MKAGPARLALGLMSGTSADGCSVCLVRSGPGSRFKVLAHKTYPYGPALRARILGAAQGSVEDLARLHFELGGLFGRQAVRFLREIGVAPRGVRVVGSHGQTVVHLPAGRLPATLQIGELSIIAEVAGLPVVGDFRPSDLAAGGQGAPLVPFLDQALFGQGPPRAFQNIGGIANVCAVGRGAAPLAFDTGPGNCLIDLAARAATRGAWAFDRDGRLAGRGRLDRRLARRMLGLAYFRRPPPKSLDRSAFGEAFLKRWMGPLLKRRPNDAVATLTLFAAASIADAYKGFVLPKRRIREVVLSGGGAFNPVLVGHLIDLLRPIPVRLISDFGIPVQAKEPACFAWMALRALEGLPNHCPEATGARGPRVLGKIVRP